ncbi:MAG: 1-deoxy-D-xylulose-5-phosphate reductoisomerase [Spirochaetia bacterium]|nr:1-deoxy-D-xylulose-5-phosphate reductoisomerase [Spirochaetia bacterium]
MHKRIIVLGVTGSIGWNTLEFIRSQREHFTIVGMSAHTASDKLLELSAEFPLSKLALSGSTSCEHERITYHGEQGLLDMITDEQADIVVNGISGASGLMPSVAALSSGKDLALANKETAVIAGSLIMRLASDMGRTILPVDSEHAAIFQLSRYRPAVQLNKIILTSSGGPFRNSDYKTLLNATPEMALRHPTWTMGSKISIDSATLANKGLEVIETTSLFAVTHSDIEVLIHPQSYVHSLVRTTDGSLYAQISEPDMRVPIMNALLYPHIGKRSFTQLDLTDKVLEFFKPDLGRFPMLQYAYDVLKSAGSYSIVYNAANEVAVEYFLNKKVGFMDIHRIVNQTLQDDWVHTPSSFDEVLEIDTYTRIRTLENIKNKCY